MKRSRYTEMQMIGSCRSRTPQHQLRSCAAYRARVQRVIQLALHETFRGLEPRFAGKRGRQTATVTVCWRSARQMTGSIRTRHQEYFPAALEAIQSSPFLLAPTVLDSVLPVEPKSVRYAVQFYLESRLIDTRSAGRGRVPHTISAAGPQRRRDRWPDCGDEQNYFAVVAM